ncbi:MAG: zf-HC2 domain-containing protein [Candidatus Eiseniibacteriota bacterium]
MDHQEASPLVSDWVRGELGGSRAALVERHVAGCRECRDAAEAVRALVAEAGRMRGAAVAHPPADTLARYVTAPREEPFASLAGVAIHLQGCAPCREDVALMREASVPGWWRPIRAWFASAPPLPRALQPAFAAAVVLLIVPAWFGIVDAPRQRAESEGRVRAAEEARAKAESEAAFLAQRAAEAPRGGGVAALVLRGATRSAEEAPTLWLRADQALQPLLLDVTPPDAPITVRLVGADGVIAWSASGARDEFWDEANRLVGVLVPAALLQPGEHRVELSAGPDEPAFFSAAFRVLPVQ